MHFMILILVFLLGAVLWGFFHANPPGAARGRLLMCNVAILILGVVGAVAIATMLYQDAISVKAGEKGMATYLAIMAGGTSFMIFTVVGGLLRNFVVFPRSARAQVPPDAPPG